MQIWNELCAANAIVLLARGSNTMENIQKKYGNNSKLLRIRHHHVAKQY